jgi:mannose-6-phosphate isomerase-like protein (cupin superfamily)
MALTAATITRTTAFTTLSVPAWIGGTGVSRVVNLTFRASGVLDRRGRRLVWPLGGCLLGDAGNLTAATIDNRTDARYGGDRRMNEKPNWQVAHLDDIERRGRDVPVREHLGIQAFGINAYTPGEDGTLINEHNEAGSGQEELYIVLEGTATFEVDGEAVDAPAGTLVFVRPESRRQATGDGTVLAVGATPGEAYQGVDWGEAWPFHSESMTAYGEQRYADALEAVRGALEHVPDHAGLHYNYACFATLAGDTGDDTFAHLRRSVELSPRFREDARRDDDFAAVRDDPRFEEALR